MVSDTTGFRVPPVRFWSAVEPDLCTAAIQILMKQSIVHVALLVNDYDEAIEFYTRKLNFSLIEDTYIEEQGKRWVLVAPPGSRGTNLLLARPSTPDQKRFVGNQTGGRVSFFLGTNAFRHDYEAMVARGVRFVRKPRKESYGTVAVFEDLYGNLWDLVETKTSNSGEAAV